MVTFLEVLLAVQRGQSLLASDVFTNPVSLLSFSSSLSPPPHTPHVHTTLLASRPQTDSSLRPGKPAKAPAPIPAKAL